LADLTVLLDENIADDLADWLAARKPEWTVFAAVRVGLAGRPDDEIFVWAQNHGAVIVSYDEDFSDQRLFPIGTHAGVIRLRVRPTTRELTRAAIDRVLVSVQDGDLVGALVIVDANGVRVRRF
jgi:predicted nuclease of predicted toxin-antitoxin system